MVDRVIAVPVPDPFLDGYEYIFRNAVTIDLTSDEFNLTVSTDNDWILLLIDSQAERKDQIVGFASLNDNADNLTLLPVTESEDDIDLGTLELSGDEAFDADSLVSAASSFTISLSKLKEIAEYDNIVKTIKNTYINGDLEQCSGFLPAFVYNWTIPSGSMVKNRFSDPNDYVYNGYHVFFSSEKNNGISFENVVDKSTSVQLIPPAQIELEEEYGLDGSKSRFWNVFENTGTMNSEERSDGMWSTSDSCPFSIISNGDQFRVDTASAKFINLPEGWWRINVAGTDIAWFDLAVSSPFYQDIPTVYRPSFKFTVNGDNQVERIDIKWYLYNFDTDQYEEITDLTELYHAAAWMGLGWADKNVAGREAGENMFYQTSYVPEETWYFFDETQSTTNVMRNFGLSYRMFGVNFGVSVVE